MEGELERSWRQTENNLRTYQVNTIRHALQLECFFDSLCYQFTQLPKGRYEFHPDQAFEKYCYITNHDIGDKKVAFLLEGFDSVEIEGNGSELIFHGQIFPFQFENCKKVTVKNLSVDWDIPFLFQGEVVAVNEQEGYRDLKPTTEGFSWKVEDGKLYFPDTGGFSFDEPGQTLPWDPEHKRVSHGAWDTTSQPDRVEELEGGIVRFHEKLKNYPPVGSILGSKGTRGLNRYSPAFHAIFPATCCSRTLWSTTHSAWASWLSVLQTSLYQAAGCIYLKAVTGWFPSSPTRLTFVIRREM